LCVFGEGQQAKAEGRLHSVCDNVCVFGVHGDLTSAGYPSNFASGSRCQWLVCGTKINGGKGCHCVRHGYHR
jgi:hypothetical protein